MKDLDALVIGGGPSGSTAALLLARAGWNVAVVERAAFPRRKVCGEYVSGASWPLLRELGVVDALLTCAGPEVAEVGLYAGDTAVRAPMPRLAAWGRAIGRDVLDARLLERARAAGAQVIQPARVIGVARDGNAFRCSVIAKRTHEVDSLTARIVIAAHGSWEPGALPTQETHRTAGPRDLLGFKAHFRDAALPSTLMPLVLFEGGYGGLVQTSEGRVSLSCCVRRSALEGARARWPGRSAGDALLAHIVATNQAVARAFERARIDGEWLAAGPIRPRQRAVRRGGLFAVGNAAGESHPIIAEGISMAIQSSILVCDLLVEAGTSAFRESEQLVIAERYRAAWRRNFSLRLHAADAFARLTMGATTRAAAVAVMETSPSLLTLGARFSGKAAMLRRPAELRAA